MPSDPISFDAACELVRSGVPFGGVCPWLLDGDHDRFREWYVRADGVPALALRAAELVPLPSANGHSESRVMGYSGDICVSCQGSRMIRNGSCLVCLDCSSTTGCG